MLQIVEAQSKYALSELSKKKYKWSVKTEKNKKVLCLHFDNTSFIINDFCRNEVCFKYISEFENKYIDLESLLQTHFWVWKSNINKI